MTVLVWHPLLAWANTFVAHVENGIVTIRARIQTTDVAPIVDVEIPCSVEPRKGARRLTRRDEETWSIEAHRPDPDLPELYVVLSGMPETLARSVTYANRT